MRPGISGKLFCAIFATCMLVLITMHWGVRISFERGFIDYIERGNEQRALQLRDALEDIYQQNGDDWRFLHNDERLLFRLLRSFEQTGGRDDTAGLPLHGWRTRLWVMDAQKKRLAGSSSPIPDGSSWLPINADGRNVGWVVASPVSGLTRDTDINFDRQQRRTSWLIVALSTLLALTATWLMSRGLLAPVRRLVSGMHLLAAGKFNTRVEVGSRDELGRLAQDFNQLANTLEKNERSRRVFMADVSHELRTPLTVLRGELEAILDGVRRPDRASLLSLQSEVATLTKLVNDLHQLSLSDHGALAYRKSTLDAIHLLQITIAAFRERYQQKQIALRTDFPPSARVFGDPDRLTQLFNNLLENSLRYTDGGGQLLVRASLSRDLLRLSWQDSAPGVSDEQLTLIFERFYRAESSRNRNSGGSGLGLSVCNNIVEAHGGRLYAEHSPTGGLTMTVELPLQAAE
ncbi:two-component system sensor histidine kinase BaeS [Affinibrenneria salicis]|uniref:histidine kinase n=1 Tax=Affinibrenneria salicis TaxID=2590031 RepID=A0A5J5FXR5_9GAMM|nr:two-component system sensor histidine kinase BaeS [Affinibrenneria salicis]KAA8998894.1 two-component system sensor histidine kinase BaeS [Affinibrenneria salicis]